MQCQIPQETLFKTNSLSSWRDPTKKNRYHFKFPNNWITTVQKESIIGIRSLYIIPSYKHILIDIKVNVIYLDHSSFEWQVDPIDNIVVRTEMLILENLKLIDIIKQININISEQFKPESIIFDSNYLSFLKCFVYNKTISESEHDLQFIIKSDYNEMSVDERTEDVIVNDVTYHRQYMIAFEIDEINDEARALLHFNVNDAGEVIGRDGDISDPIDTHGLYDYNECNAYSDLACMTEDSFLGRTRNSDIIPIKYYELKNNNQSFWVDLYSARDNKVAVELNKGDDLYIEAQLLMSSEAVL